jgi:short-subunit dehydrogenase
VPIAVVTGAASGIGRALAVALARSGHTLALADRNEAGLEDTIAQLHDRSIAKASVVDVSQQAEVEAFAQDVGRRHGRIDLLINNAGVSIAGSVAELTVSEMAWVMNVNFWGVVHGVKAFLPLMLAHRSGTIVNVSSVFGLWGPPGQSAYTASKFAVRGFSESLRGELQGTGLHVLTVHPAGVRTGIARTSRIAAAADRAAAERRRDEFDRRLLTIPPEDAAKAILDGVAKRRDRVLIGTDAYKIDVLTRLLGPRGARILSNAVLRRTAENGG